MEFRIRPGNVPPGKKVRTLTKLIRVGSLQFKFAVTYMFILVAVLAVLNTYPVLVTQDLVFQSKQTTLQGHASVIAASLSGLETLTVDGVDQVMTLLDDQNLTRILVTDPVGKILFDNSSQSENVGKYALFKEISGAMSGNDVFYSTFRNGAFMSRAAVPVISRGNPIGIVYVYEYDAEQGALLLDVQSNLRNISLLVSVIVILCSLFFSRALTSRVGELLRAIRIVREGKYSHRAAIRGRDELTELAGEFNRLTDRLQTTEEMRRRFVSDASHELKTPLASISLLADSILENENMDDDTVGEFVSDIREEAHRLHRITEKLLILTRLDAAPPPPPDPTNGKTVVEGVLHMLRPLAMACDITLSLEAGEDCVVGVGADDLYQIASNLIENAIKYSSPGGRVDVTLTGGETVAFSVKDTGIGIPEADLSRVFERFYRVDKARSRDAGGAGLGLSIVQEAVLRGGGQISVERRPEGGTCFLVLFPSCRPPPPPSDSP